MIMADIPPRVVGAARGPRRWKYAPREKPKPLPARAKRLFACAFSSGIGARQDTTVMPWLSHPQVYRNCAIDGTESCERSNL